MRHSEAPSDVEMTEKVAGEPFAIPRRVRSFPRFIVEIVGLLTVNLIARVSRIVFARRPRGVRQQKTMARKARDDVTDSMFAEAARSQELLRAAELESRTLEFRLGGASTALPPGVLVCVKVYYATDRNSVGRSEGTVDYQGRRGDRLRYGTCEVTLPEDHRMGHLETPSIWRLEFGPNPAKHVVFEKAIELPVDRFYDQLRGDVMNAASRELFVFVHGFANSFEDAARRTAQLSYDLGYKGIPVMYSWPSQGRISLGGYRYDETNIDWTIPHLRSFLLDLAGRSGADHINLIAHSMGNRILANAIVRLSAQVQQLGKPTFNHMVLTAPDIDAQVFKDDLIPEMKKVSKRVTLYASSEDKALAFSKRIHGDYPRAGDTRPEIVVADGIDSVDVSQIDTYFFSVGHSYFGDNRTIISDLFLLFRDDSPPAQRNLLPQPSTAPKWWVFRP